MMWRKQKQQVPDKNPAETSEALLGSRHRGFDLQGRKQDSGKISEVQHFSWFQSTLAMFPLKMSTKLCLYFSNVETTEFCNCVSTK